MEPFAEHYYEMRFERDFIKSKGNEFQELFCTIMERVHGADFLRCRPWGNIGDRKNDGYLRSKRTLFQVFAPLEIAASDTVKKMEEDYTEAKPYWIEYFDVWTFVHNAIGGLPPPVLKKFLELGERDARVAVNQFGYGQFQGALFSLDEQNIASVLGIFPISKLVSKEVMLRISYEHIQPVIKYLLKKPGRAVMCSRTCLN